jgi:hypothetical protein
MTADNWDLHNQKFGNNQAEYPSIVGEVTFDFFRSIMNFDAPVKENVNNCGVATADEMKHGNHSDSDFGMSLGWVLHRHIEIVPISI